MDNVSMTGLFKTGPFGGCSRSIVAKIFGFFLLISIASVPLQAQYKIPEQWEQWFYGQRMYGLGYIPNDALSRAVAQRDKQQSVGRRIAADTLGKFNGAINDGSNPDAVALDGDQPSEVTD